MRLRHGLSLTDYGLFDVYVSGWKISNLDLAILANYHFPMQFTVHHAKSQLSKLIDAALQGEEVVIAKGDTPVVRLVPVPQGKFKMGALADQVTTCPDFFEPMSQEELNSWEGG